MTVHSPCQRTAPFLHRTWLKSIKALQDTAVMGNIISSPTQRSTWVDHSDRPRPAKRCRLSSVGEADHDFLSTGEPDSTSHLRIEHIKILRRDTKKIKSISPPRDLHVTKARCKVAVFDLTSGFPVVLHCQSQLCDLVTYRNPAGPHRVARVDLPSPFLIPRESVLINRPDNGEFDLADNYQIRVEIEAANGVQWPLIDLHDFGLPMSSLQTSTGVSRHCILSSRFDALVGRLKQPLSLDAAYSSAQPCYQTDYIMDVDLKWTQKLKPLRHLSRDCNSCITAINTNINPRSHVKSDYLSNGRVDSLASGRESLETSSIHEDEDLDDQTPLRSLRAREKSKVYNLKVLSDQAQGQDRRRRTRSYGATDIEGRIQYLLPPDQPICLDYFRCVTCGAYHESFSELRLHLQTAHANYNYVLDTTSQGWQLQVAVAEERAFDALDGQPPSRTPFRLQTLEIGEQSRASPFNGPDDDEWRPNSIKQLPSRLRSGSPLVNGFNNLPRRAAKSKPKKSRVIVPKISQPLYHPISKARLVPGQEVPDVMPDDQWLIQKHRESIGEFSDVSGPEKEYIWEWDGFILAKNITSAAYFPRAWLQFTEEKASWLVAKECRMLEFGKHASVLFARDVLDDKTVSTAFSFIDRARARLQEDTQDVSSQPSGGFEPVEAVGKQSPRSSQIRKSSAGCTICQLPVLGPTLLVCANKSCSYRLYHSTCAKKDAVMSLTRSRWLCNVCHAKEKSN